MKILSLKINNFRQFEKEQIIQFSHDKDKKTTFIFGESGHGKTTILEAAKWVFYGECKYETVLNKYSEENLNRGQRSNVSVSLQLQYDNKEYTLIRTAIYEKGTKIANLISNELKIDIKNENGITKQEKGQDAEKIVRGIIHKDLLKYFFLEGENLDDYGDAITNKRNQQFIDAIKGLLGINYYYSSTEHLGTLIAQYRSAMQSLSKDNEYTSLLINIGKLKQEIETKKEELRTECDNFDTYDKKYNELNTKIQTYAGIQEKQDRSISLNNEIIKLKNKIDESQKQIIKLFSAKAYNLFMSDLIENGEKIISNAKDIDESIPGIELSAIDYMLKHKKCICGHSIEEGSPEWIELNKWKDLVPPNNVGHELSAYKTGVYQSRKDSSDFCSRFDQLRKSLNEDITSYNQKVDELEDIDEIIKSSPDVGELKKQELDYKQKRDAANVKKGMLTSKINDLESTLKEDEYKVTIYQTTDEKINTLREYMNCADEIKTLIETHLKDNEAQKRKELQTAINEIFKNYYKNDVVELTLDSSYNIQLNADDSLLSDFVSGGQRIAVALAFIGAIVKLSSTINDEDIEKNIRKEIYPLMLDAPVSNFGMQQIDSFAKITPSVTNQVIVLLNDKDGPILKEYMKDSIGCYYEIEKLDTYRSVIKEVR